MARKSTTTKTSRSLKNATKQDKREKQPKLSKAQIKEQAYLGWGKINNPVYPKKYILTGFELGKEADQGCLAALRMVAKYVGADLLFTPVNAQVKALESQEELCAVPGIKAKDIVREFRFNDNLKLHDARVNAQQNDPLTGLFDYGDHVNESIIVGHTKMNMRMQATGTTSHPRMVRSTGVCTKPDYRENRAGQIAHRKHKLGGLLIEVVSRTKFLIRELYFKDGEIYSICKLKNHKNPGVWQFNPKFARPRKSWLAGLVCGDIHVGHEDKDSLKAAYEQQRLLRPDYTIFHDFMDFNNPWSHHSINKKSTHLNRDSFYEDMMKCKEYFDGFVSQAEEIGSEIVMVPSNHHEHLHKFLDSGYYQKTVGEDYKLALELCYKWHCLGMDPFIALLDEDQEKAIWLPLDNDFKIHGNHVGNHGHLGLGGSRGSVKQMARTFRNSVSGHTHSPETLDDHMTVGTSSLLNMPYTKGQGNTFMHSNVGCFLNGTKQQIPIIKGEWFL